MERTQRLEEMGTPELVRHAVEEARLLVRAELRHARRELEAELVQARRTAGFGGAAGVLGLCGLSSLGVALGVALPGATGWGVLWVGLVQCLGAAVLAWAAFRAAPRRPLGRTRGRLQGDVTGARETLKWN
ncbi:MAG: hypothetical protein RL653_4382 [Pseudomonadota bacterium]|jgi:hypothetical protein